MNRREFLGAMAAAPAVMRGRMTGKQPSAACGAHLRDHHEDRCSRNRTMPAWPGCHCRWRALPRIKSIAATPFGGNADKTRVEKLAGFWCRDPRRRVGAHDAAARARGHDEGGDEDHRVSLAIAERRDAHRRSRQLSEAHQADSRRRHRQADRRRDHEGQGVRSREGARDLRLDRREHRSRSPT